MSMLTRCRRPVRRCHNSLAARADAAAVACATVPTANDDGSAGSVPVKVIASRPAGGWPAARHKSARTFLGEGGLIGGDHKLFAGAWGGSALRSCRKSDTNGLIQPVTPL